MQKWVRGVLVFVLLLAFSYIPPLKSADAVSFSDVGSDYWAASEIADLADKGVLNGYPDGTFKPDSNVTRAEFAKIIGLAMGYSPNPSASQKFPDVAQDHWAFGNIASAVDHGLVQGYPDGTFGPSRNVTKAEILTIIARAQNWSGGSGSHFNDVPSGYWAFADIEACFVNGIVKTSDLNIVYSGNLGPDEPATRAQTCVFTDRMIKAQGQVATTVKSKIAFESYRDGKAEIYIMNVDGTGQTRLINNPTNDGAPSFSPDGAKIVFMSNRDGNLEIYIMNVDGSEQTRLTNNPASDTKPSFSPDGAKIAFLSNRDGNLEIYIMNVDGSEQTRLTNNPASDGGPSFSPDGSKIAFVSNRDDGNYEIYIMNVDGTGQTRLTNNPAADTGPSFSPDGSKIAFFSDRDGNFEIYKMNVDGSEQVRLTNNPAEDGDPSFSPDGAKIVFYSDRDRNYEIYIMNVDGSEQVNLTNNPGDDWAPSFSPIP